jgi:glucose-6-phosphate 1-dehydrogenase
MKPTQGIHIAFCARAPGLENKVMAADMAFEFPAGPFGDEAKGYERPLHDAMSGDPILFASATFIEHGWKLVQPLLEAWAPERRADVPTYAAGSQGPREADQLLAQTGHSWRILAESYRPSAPIAGALNLDRPLGARLRSHSRHSR